MFIYDYAKQHQPIRKQDKLQITNNKGTSTHKSNELHKKLAHVFEGDQLRQCNDLLSKMISLILETHGPVFHIFSFI